MIIVEIFFGMIGMIGILILSIFMYAIVAAFIKHIRRPKVRSNAHNYWPPKKEISDLVKKRFPGFDCYESTIGSDGKPVIVVHRTMTQTELSK